MYRKSGKIFHANVHIGISVLLLSLFTLPSSAASLSISSNGDIGSTNTSPVYAIDPSAPNYAPTASGNLRVGSVNEIRYDTIFISDGIDINIFSPDNTSVTLIANGDINIAGSLNWSGGRLSLISIAGDFNLSGFITARSLVLSAGVVNLAKSSKISVSGENARTNNRDIQLITGGEIALSAVTLPSVLGNITISNGNTQLTTVNKVVLSAVPLPPTLWLFGSGLLGLAGIFRYHKIQLG